MLPTGERQAKGAPGAWAVLVAPVERVGQSPMPRSLRHTRIAEMGATGAQAAQVETPAMVAMAALVETFSLPLEICLSVRSR